MNIDSKMDLLLENTERLEKTDKNLRDLRDDISDLQEKIVYHMPNFNGLEYIINQEFPKVIQQLGKIERNTK